MLFKEKPICSKEQELIDRLEENGFLFGSRAWNVASKNSDYDYIITYKSYKNNIDYFKKYKIIHSDDYIGVFYINATIKIKINKRIYNVIIVYPRYISSLKTATEILPKLKLPLKIKAVRRKLFNELTKFLSYKSYQIKDYKLQKQLAKFYPELLI